MLAKSSESWQPSYRCTTDFSRMPYNLTCNASFLPTVVCLSVQSSGHIQSDWHPQIRGLSDPAARVCFGKALLLYSRQRHVMQNPRANCRCCKEVCHRITGSCGSPVSQICRRSLVRYGAQLLLPKSLLAADLLCKCTLSHSCICITTPAGGSLAQVIVQSSPIFTDLKQLVHAD